MTPKDPFFGGDFVGQILAADSLKGAFVGITERGVPQAYVCARASSVTLCLVHVSRVFLCTFYIKKGIWYVSKRAWIHVWYVSRPVPPCHSTLVMIILVL